MCPLKEPHFFSTDIIYERGVDWYKGLYADAGSDQICGEASTSYTRYPFTPLTPQRIHEIIPNIKLIYIIRDPVARVESECLQIFKYSRYILKDNSLPSSCDGMIKLLKDRDNEYGIDPIRTSEYINQIDQYLRFFTSDRLLVLFQSALLKDHATLLSKVCNFLCIENEFQTITPLKRNVTKEFKQGLASEKVSQFLNKIPGIFLFKPLSENFIIKSLKNYLISKISKQVFKPMSKRTRIDLYNHFRPFNNRLAELLNCDLSHWNY